jgi:hypothetical protein
MTRITHNEGDETMKTRRYIKASEVNNCETVTTIDPSHGNAIGLGKLFNGRVYKSDGNGFYHLALGVRYLKDAGHRYCGEVERLYPVR